MPSKLRRTDSSPKATLQPEGKIEPARSLPMPEVLSFLKETRGLASWTTRDLAKSLNVGTAVAQQVIPLMQVQGYIETARNGEWMTTAAGDTVSGSKPPRFTPGAVEGALSSLAERIKSVNVDPNALFHVAATVAFGDFLSDRARVQAADVGVKLVRGKNETEEEGSAVEQKAERAFLKQLKGKGAVLNLRP